MDEFFERLKSFGFEKEEVMGRFLEDDSFYLECYYQLVEDEGFEKLGEFLEEGNRKEAFDSAHALKGITSNMGLMTMFQLVSKIVEMLRSEDSEEDPTPLYNELLVELEACKALLELVEE